MYRSVSSGLLARQGLSSFWNTSTSSTDDLNSILNNIKNKTASKKQNQFLSSNQAVNTTINESKGYFDPKSGNWVTAGNQLEVYQTLEDRQQFNQTIQKVLGAKGIKLSPKEKMTINVDQNGQITISGISNEQKKIMIEEALNTTEQLGSGLLLHIETVKMMNGKLNPLELKKWLVADFLKDYAQQELSQLKLVNGRIVGANEKLQKILDSDVKDLGNDAELYQTAITDLKSILAYGVNKIKDMKPSIDFQNGSLIDQDVKYGFGQDQLKGWYGKVMSGQARWDLKA